MARAFALACWLGFVAAVAVLLPVSTATLPSQDLRPPQAPTLWEHLDSVYSIAFSPDSRSLVTGGYPEHAAAVNVWDVATGRLRFGLAAADFVVAVSYSPDGRHIATSGFDVNGASRLPKVVLWDATTGKKLQTFEGLACPSQLLGAMVMSGALPGLAFAPHGRTLATGGVMVDEGKYIPVVQLWDTSTGAERGVLKASGDERFGMIGRLTFSPDGRLLAAAKLGAAHSSVIVWEMASYKPRLVLRVMQDQAAIQGLAFALDSRSLVWAAGPLAHSGASELIEADLLHGACVKPLQAHEEGTSAIAFSPDGKLMASGGSRGGTVKVWDAVTHEEKAILSGFGPRADVSAVAFSPDGKTLAAGAGGKRNTICLWNAATLIRRFAPEEDALRLQEETEHQKKLAADKVAAKDQERRWQEEEKNLTAVQRAKLRAAEDLAKRNGYALQLNLARQAIDRGHLDSAAQILDAFQPAAGQEDMRTFAWHYLRRQSQIKVRALQHHAQVALAKLAPDGKTLALAAWDHTVSLWDVASGKKCGTIEAHPEPIRCLEFSPDSNTVATAGGRQDQDPEADFVRLWAADSGKLLAVLKGHAATVQCLAFAPDGKTLATGGKDNTVRLWSLPSGKMTVLDSTSSEVLAIAFSPDGKTVVSGDLDGNVHIWDMDTRKLRHAFTAEKGNWVFSLNFVPDGKTLLITNGHQLYRKNSIESQPTTTQLWDITANKPRVLRTWAGLSHAFFSPDGTKLALCSREGGVVWNLKTDGLVTRFPATWPDVPLVAFAPDSKTLLVGRKSLDRSLSNLRLLHTGTGETLGVYEGLFDSPAALRLAAGGRTTAVGAAGNKIHLVQITLGRKAVERLFSHYWAGCALAVSPLESVVALMDHEDLTVKLWNLEAGKEVALFDASKFGLHEIGFSTDGKALFLTDRNRPVVLKVLDVATGKERTTLTSSLRGTVQTNGKVAAVGGNNATVTLYDLATGAKLATLKGDWIGMKKPNAKDDIAPEVSEVRLSSGGRWVVGKTEDGVMTVWDAASGKVLRTWPPATAPVDFAFAPDDKTLLTSDIEGTLRVLDLPTMKLRGLLPKAWKAEGSVGFTRDGRSAAIVSSETVVTVLDLATCALRLRLPAQLTPVTSIAWSPDGKTLVTGTEHGTIQCWDPVIGQLRLSLEGHTRKVTRLLFTADGATLLSVDQSGRVLVWSGNNIPLGPGQPQRRLGQSFSPKD